MSKFAVCILAIFALCCGVAHGDVRKEQLGTWKVVTVSTLGKEKAVFNGRAKIWRLKTGTVRVTNRGTVRGSRIRTEAWSYRNGTSESYSYVNGELSEFAEGTWEKIGKRVAFTNFFEGLNGTGRAAGYTRRINRNKFISYAEIKISGVRQKIRQTSTFTRIRR